jgi:hypothetical protein
MLRCAPSGNDRQLTSCAQLLRGAVADQAELHGVLAQIEALWLELIELSRLPSDL